MVISRVDDQKADGPDMRQEYDGNLCNHADYGEKINKKIDGDYEGCERLGFLLQW